MAADDGVETGGGWVEVRSARSCRTGVDQPAVDLDQFRFRQKRRPFALVDIAAHRDDRRDAPQRFQDSRVADIAGMDDGSQPASAASACGAAGRACPR